MEIYGIKFSQLHYCTHPHHHMYVQTEAEAQINIVLKLELTPGGGLELKTFDHGAEHYHHNVI